MRVTTNILVTTGANNVLRRKKTNQKALNPHPNEVSTLSPRSNPKEETARKKNHAL